MMKHNFLLLLILAQPSHPTYAQSAAPEIVQGSEVMVDRDVKRITMESETGRYVISCSLKLAGCITPVPQRLYYLFTVSTKWQMPNTDQPIDLKFVQKYTTSYPNGENIGLVAVDMGWPDSLGIFVLNSWSKH